MPTYVKPADLGPFDRQLAKRFGVVALFMFNEDGSYRELMTNRTVTAANGDRINTPEGKAPTFAGASGVNMTFPLGGSAVTARYLVCGRIRANAQQAGEPGCIFGISSSGATQSGSGIGWDNSATPNVGGTRLTSTAANTYAKTATAIGRYNTVFAQCNNNGGAGSAWIDGRPATTGQGGAVTGTVTTYDQITIAAQWRTAGFLRQAKGEILWGAVIDLGSDVTSTGPFFTDDRAFSLYASNFPYNLFRSARRRAHDLEEAVGGGGSTFNDSFTESVTVTDSLAVTATFRPSYTETTTVTDSLGTVTVTFRPSYTETVTVTDSLAVAGTFPNAFTETVTLTDSATGGNIFVESLTESVTLSDSLATPVFVFNASFSETITVTDSLSVSGGSESTSIWSPVSAASGSWSAGSAASGTWGAVTPASGSWSGSSAAGGTWTPVTPATGTWT